MKVQVREGMRGFDGITMRESGETFEMAKEKVYRKDGRIASWLQVVDEKPVAVEKEVPAMLRKPKVTT